MYILYYLCERERKEETKNVYSHLVIVICRDIGRKHKKVLINETVVGEREDSKQGQVKESPLLVYLFYIKAYNHITY